MCTQFYLLFCRKPDLPLPELKQDQDGVHEKHTSKVVSANSADVVSMEDLLHALRDALHKEIALVKTLEGSKLGALKSFVKMVTNFFPVDRRETRIFLDDLNNWIQTKEEIEVALQT